MDTFAEDLACLRDLISSSDNHVGKVKYSGQQQQHERLAQKVVRAIIIGGRAACYVYRSTAFRDVGWMGGGCWMQSLWRQVSS